MRRILALAAITAVALLGTTCNPAANDIFPMSVGSVWNMELCLLAGTTLATLDTVQTGTVTNTALEKASLTNGKEVTKFKNESSVTVRVGESTATHDTTTYSYMGEDGDAILSYGSLDDTLGDTVMMSNPKRRPDVDPGLIRDRHGHRPGGRDGHGRDVQERVEGKAVFHDRRLHH